MQPQPINIMKTDKFNERELELVRCKDPQYLYDNYFAGKSNITLQDLYRMRGMTILMNNGNDDDALLFGLMNIN